MTLTVYLKKVKMSSFFFFFMYIMSTTEAIGVVNSLDKDQILVFKTFSFFRNFPFPQGVYCIAVAFR